MATEIMWAAKPEDIGRQMVGLVKNPGPGQPWLGCVSQFASGQWSAFYGMLSAPVDLGEFGSEAEGVAALIRCQNDREYRESKQDEAVAARMQHRRAA